MLAPLDTLRDTMGHLALGKLNTPVPFMDYGSEIGEMARAVQVFKEEGGKAEALRWVRAHVADLSTNMRRAKGKTPRMFGAEGRSYPVQLRLNITPHRAVRWDGF